MQSISKEEERKIFQRYERIARSLIMDFWGLDREKVKEVKVESYCFFVGSYGRGTAIGSSDVDILMCLPEKEFYRFSAYKNNGQSSLIQNFKQEIQDNDARLASVEGDGQVVVIEFCDETIFEILPAFKKVGTIGKYTYPEYIHPDSNKGGKWRSTDPLREQKAIRDKNRKSNGLLVDTCRCIRKIRDDEGLYVPGCVIDSFACDAIGHWKWKDPRQGSMGFGGSNSTLNQFVRRLLSMATKDLGNSLKMPGSGDIVRVQRDEVKNLVKILECIS